MQANKKSLLLKIFPIYIYKSDNVMAGKEKKTAGGNSHFTVRRACTTRQASKHACLHTLVNSPIIPNAKFRSRARRQETRFRPD